MGYQYKHLVIVHGIGDQLRNETSISFMNEFIRSLPSEVRDTVEVHNLVEGDAKEAAKEAARPAYMTCTIEKVQCAIAFSEVYWQPVPNDYLRVNLNPPVPVFVWAHSINTRLLQGGPKFQRAREAINNLEALLADCRSLAKIYKKAGVLTEVLVKFLCDVQMYVESEVLRRDINKQFLDVLANVGARREAVREEILSDSGNDLSGRDIYIVAHSEGTVVAYNSLVLASSQREGQPDEHRWLDDVRTLVTLGSPLDKHYTIWRNRFRTNELKTTARTRKIAWRNYWDRSDPVGYGLDALFRNDQTDAARLFTVTRDDAFTRYPIPGKAHVDYWTDAAIHDDILQEIVGNEEHRSKVVDSWWAPLLVSGDYLGYLGGRVFTAAAILFFLSRVLSPLEKALHFDWVCQSAWLSCSQANTWYAAFSAIATPLALNGVLEMDRDWKPGLLRTAHELMWGARSRWPTVIGMLRGLAVTTWLAACALVTLALGVHFRANVEIKDWVGYVVGLVAAVLVWRLQTRIHTGLLQLWRYTGGHHTSCKATNPPNVTSDPPVGHRVAQRTAAE